MLFPTFVWLLGSLPYIALSRGTGDLVDPPHKDRSSVAFNLVKVIECLYKVKFTPTENRTLIAPLGEVSAIHYTIGAWRSRSGSNSPVGTRSFTTTDDFTVNSRWSEDDEIIIHLHSNQLSYGTLVEVSPPHYTPGEF